MEQVLSYIIKAAPLWLVERSMGSQKWLELKQIEIEIVLQVKKKRTTDFVFENDRFRVLKIVLFLFLECRRICAVETKSNDRKIKI